MAEAKPDSGKSDSGKKCKQEGCKRPYRAKGYCGVHYRTWRCGELPHARYRTCTTEECHKKVSKKSLCEEHLRAKYPGLAPKQPEAAPAPAVAEAPQEAPAAS